MSKLLTQLDQLYKLLSILDGRISFVLSHAATAAHALPGEFETQRQYIMRACICVSLPNRSTLMLPLTWRTDTLQLAWSSLSLPVFTDLKRRIEALKTGTTASMSERRRTRERLETLLGQVYRTTIKGARMVASCVHGAPSLAFLTHLHQERLESWIEILLEASTVDEGGEGLTAAEKQNDLQWCVMLPNHGHVRSLNRVTDDGTGCLTASESWAGHGPTSRTSSAPSSRASLSFP